ncbi:gliding motility-associated ABC transporter ATP-binding subunit GldA [Pleomorphovibrio marinus]|uniref:gliding motility-associated ABC transporter ATP-binding subunit GldA n=1 Tax=Pleomorphovibrio marinus TaxID=2164132 RepID=UPI000E0A59C8|nr:gliding motility-associated ABC transporter ATP-binding subunit GldA [Pleomorphovibrio marinus]
MSIEVNQLTKLYGYQKALNKVDFQAKPGQILGFLGPNGAGKSTTMKIATGYILPDEGDVLIKGVSVIKHPKVVSRMIGYLPEHNPLYLEMYIPEFLTLIGGLYQLSGKVLRKQIPKVMEQCGLMPERTKKIGQLSKGYRQRVGLAKTLVHDPEIIILDEPTTGLDPNQLVEIRSLIKQISSEKTLVLSTHIMQEVEAICEKVVIIHKGKIVAQDLLGNLKSNRGQFALVLQTEEPLNKEWFGHLNVAGLKQSSPNRITLVTSQPKELRKQLLHVINTKELSLVELKQEAQDLETIFHQLTQN